MNENSTQGSNQSSGQGVANNLSAEWPQYQEVEKNIILCVILTFITFGIYYLFWQNHQIKTINKMLGREKYSFWMWLILSIITIGFYHIYHEYVMAEDIVLLQRRMGFPASDSLPIICVVLSALGVPFVADAIQQYQMHRLYGQDGL